GKCGALKKLLKDIIKENKLDPDNINSFIEVRSDQYLYSKHFVDQSLSGDKKYTLTLDYKHELFEVTGGRMRTINLPHLSSFHAFNAYKVERFLVKKLGLHAHQDEPIDIEFIASTNSFRNRKTHSNPLIIHLPGTWMYFDKIMNKILTSKKEFSLGKITAWFIGLLSYIVAIFIPFRISL
ncbi:MAG: hypothetical protein ABJZ92_08870, partial [Cyclobacteriaceae bacterium]